MSARIVMNEIDESDVSHFPCYIPREPEHYDRCPIGLDLITRDLQKDAQDYRETQKEILLNIKELKDCLLNPEKGIYGRMKQLETVKAATSKWFWVALSTITSAGVLAFARLIF